MAKEKKVNSRYTTPADTEKVETFLINPIIQGMETIRFIVFWMLY